MEISTNIAAGEGQSAPLSFDRRDKLLVPTALLAGIACYEMLLPVLTRSGMPSLGYTSMALLVYCLFFLYSPALHKLTGENILLSLAVLAIAVSQAVYSAPVMHALNYAALPAVAMCHLLTVTGVGLTSWRQPQILPQSLRHLLLALGRHADKPYRALSQIFSSQRKGIRSAVIGFFIALPVLVTVTYLFASSDLVFNHLLYRLFQWDILQMAGRLFFGIALGTLLYSFLYYMRHDPGMILKEKENRLQLEPVTLITALACISGVYLVFISIQFTYLFSGGAMVSSQLSGALFPFSYASYARQGFFELVFVALLSLTVIMLSITFCKPTGKGWLAVRVLSALITGLTGVILYSAAMRMLLYISAYGLSVLRAMTLWGMVMIALWLVFAVIKIFRGQQFSFFRLCFASAVVGWCLLSLINLNGLVAQINADQYISGDLEAVDTYYLFTLDVDALPALEKLQEHIEQTDKPFSDQDMLDRRITLLHNKALADVSHWSTWNLSSWRAVEQMEL